jgi:nicotinamidase-related amidase
LQVPVIYANDHWGHWTQSVPALVDSLIASGLPGARLARLLAPRATDFTMLKPRNSAFFGTPLDFLLEELCVSRLILTGLAANNCVLFTAHDAYVRKHAVWIPADCTACERDDDRLTALAHMRSVVKAYTASARQIIPRIAPR